MKALPVLLTILFLFPLSLEAQSQCPSLYLSLEKYVFSELEKIETYYYRFIKENQEIHGDIIQHSNGLKSYYGQIYEEKLSSFTGAPSLLSTKKLQDSVSHEVLKNFFSIDSRKSPSQEPLLSSENLQVKQVFRLERNRLKEQGFIVKVRFEKDFSREFQADPQFKKKIVNSLNLGLVSSNDKQNGIKKAVKGAHFIYEVKTTSYDKRLWGCVDSQGVFIIKGLANHNEIHKILQRFSC